MLVSYGNLQAVRVLGGAAEMTRRGCDHSRTSIKGFTPAYSKPRVSGQDWQRRHRWALIDPPILRFCRLHPEVVPYDRRCYNAIHCLYTLSVSFWLPLKHL
jgi:hypothetical protein